MSAAQDSSAEAATVFRLVYRSHSRIADAAEDEEFGRILRASRRNNTAHGVTGALMFYDRWFAQALEGERDTVLALFDHIKTDARHDAVEIHAQGDAPARVFARWAMAHVGEHGTPDIPLSATGTGVSETAAWKLTPEQDGVLTLLRDLTRGYGIGA